MTDPLGLIGRQAASGASSGLGRSVPAAGSGSGPSFKDVLMQNINEVNRLQQDATTAIEDLQTGQRTDVEGVLTAAQKADTAFRMLVAVRNKVQAAYEEIKQMRT